MDLSSNASLKLEPYLLVAKSAKGAAAAKLIQDVTSTPGIFFFAELLEKPNIKDLSETEHAAYLTLLQLFAFGTFQDYVDSKSSLPPLNNSQLLKLKLLTIVSLSLERRILPYSLLLRSLQIPTIRELEDLIIDGIYLDIMRGKLDQREQQFEVEYTAGRDLGPGKVETLLTSLREWAKTTSSVLATLDAQLAALAEQTVANAREKEEHEKLLNTRLAESYEKLKETAKTRNPKGVKGISQGMLEDSLAMDVDEPRIAIPLAETARTRKVKSSSIDHSKTSARKRNKV